MKGTRGKASSHLVCSEACPSPSCACDTHAYCCSDARTAARCAEHPGISLQRVLVAEQISFLQGKRLPAALGYAQVPPFSLSLFFLASAAFLLCPLPVTPLITHLPRGLPPSSRELRCAACPGSLADTSRLPARPQHHCATSWATRCAKSPCSPECPAPPCRAVLLKVCPWPVSGPRSCGL